MRRIGRAARSPRGTPALIATAVAILVIACSTGSSGGTPTPGSGTAVAGSTAVRTTQSPSAAVVLQTPGDVNPGPGTPVSNPAGAVVVATASVTSTSGGYVTTQPSAGSPSVNVHLASQNNSGLNGLATLTSEQNGRTLVVLQLNGAKGLLNADIRDGTCASLSPTARYVLTLLTNGASETDLAAPLNVLNSGNLAIAVYQGNFSPTTVVACGEIR